MHACLKSSRQNPNPSTTSTPPRLTFLALRHSHNTVSCLLGGFSRLSGGHFVPLARHHPPGHGVGPPRGCGDVVPLRVGALEVLGLHHHLHRQTVMESDDPQKRLLLVHALPDQQLDRGEWVARGKVFVESQDVVL